MTTYALYLESGPRRRKTMVHVLDLLGCVAVGPTTEDALAAAPDAIRAYRRFLRRHGEPVDPGAPFETRVVEHITEGEWLGNAGDGVSITASSNTVGGAAAGVGNVIANSGGAGVFVEPDLVAGTAAISDTISATAVICALAYSPIITSCSTDHLS